MKYEDCMLAILRDPEDDAPRKVLADLMRKPDPAWAELIETQLELTRIRRATRYRRGHPLDDRAELILNDGKYQYPTHENANRWSRELAFFQGETSQHREIEFDRGLPRFCTLNPYMFLEQGAHILSHIAPLRGIQFYDDPDGSPFPMKELAASPLLAQFDEIRFRDCKVTDDDIATFAASPHLSRLLVLDVRVAGRRLSLRSLEALAENPATRNCLFVHYEIGADDNGRGPVGEFTARDDYGYYDIEMSKDGYELERKYGYLPWLHLANNPWDPADAHYWVDQKILPMFEAGSPADSPTPRGTGVRPPRAILLRADAGQFLADTVQG